MTRNALLARIRSLAANLYGSDEADGIVELAAHLADRRPACGRDQSPLTQADSIIITYGDLLRREGTPPLNVLHEFL